MNTIKIWAPRYHDGVALIGVKWVKPGPNKIIFTKAKHLKGQEFLLLDSEIKTFPLGSNGKIPCYEVNMDYLLTKKIDKSDV